MRVDQDAAMRVYSQPVQTKSTSAVSAEIAEKQTKDAAVSAEKKPDVDRVELDRKSVV